MARATTGLSYFTFGIVILGSLVFTVFVSIPQWNQYSDAKTKLAQTLENEKANQVFLANLDQRTEDLKKYSADAKALGVVLPDSFMQSNLWVNINDLAGKAGVTINSIGESKKEAVVKNASQSLSTAKSVLNGGGEVDSAPAVNAGSVAGSKLEKWITGISVRGNYSQIRAFIKNLENSLILSDLKDLKLSAVASSEKNTAADALDAEFTIRTYVQP